MSRRLSPEEMLLGAFVVLGAFGLAATHSIWHPALRLECPLLVLTGLPCLACGGTRAAAALAAGHAGVAFAWNPLVATALAGSLGWLPWTAGVWLGWLRPPVSPGRISPLARWGILGVGALNWAYLLAWFPR